MPTGYTAAVEDGTITTLGDYAMRCARAFGMLIEMRDDPLDAPIPERFEPQTAYYDEMIVEARATLAEVDGLSAADCARRAMTEHADALDRQRGYERDRAEHLRRYEAMLEKIDAWRVPPDLDTLRQFMRDQLLESIRFDCPPTSKREPATLMSGGEWRTNIIRKTRRDLDYYQEERQREIDRVAERNHMLALLRDTLGDAP